VKPAHGSEAPGALSTKLYRGVQHVRRHLVWHLALGPWCTHSRVHLIGCSQSFAAGARGTPGAGRRKGPPSPSCSSPSSPAAYCTQARLDMLLWQRERPGSRSRA
jgi:hypothetical protein